MTRPFLLLAAAVLALGACGTTDDLPPLAAMTDTYGCGYGFWIGNPSQTAALRFQYLGDDGRAADAELPDPRWSAELLVGTDLYANWCDDVIGPDEPEPRVTARYEIVGGSIAIIGEPPGEPFQPTELTLEASGLEVRTDERTSETIGDVVIVNSSYGVFAG